jgi:hypothetical protein
VCVYVRARVYIGGIILASGVWGDPLSINPIEAVFKGPFNNDTVAQVSKETNYSVKRVLI